MARLALYTGSVGLSMAPKIEIDDEDSDEEDITEKMVELALQNMDPEKLHKLYKRVVRGTKSKLKVSYRSQPISRFVSHTGSLGNKKSDTPSDEKEETKNEMGQTLRKMPSSFELMQEKGGVGLIRGPKKINPTKSQKPSKALKALPVIHHG
uniref:Uncharacterized protein n=2 Tax=Lotharella globosa TaxID=91324 RepID=A0A7S4DDC7_9EUKA